MSSVSVQVQPVRASVRILGTTRGTTGSQARLRAGPSSVAALTHGGDLHHRYERRAA
jgi:hypothetical protein